jgi:hypothetical protein
MATPATSAPPTWRIVYRGITLTGSGEAPVVEVFGPGTTKPPVVVAPPPPAPPPVVVPRDLTPFVFPPQPADVGDKPEQRQAAVWHDPHGGPWYVVSHQFHNPLPISHRYAGDVPELLWAPYTEAGSALYVPEEAAVMWPDVIRKILAGAPPSP